MHNRSQINIACALYALTVSALSLFLNAAALNEDGGEDTSYYIACLAVGDFDFASEEQRILLESRLNQFLEVPVVHVILIGSFSNLCDEDSDQFLQDFFDRFPFYIFLVPTDDVTAVSYATNYSELPDYHIHANDSFMFLGSLNNYGGEEIDDKAGRIHRNRRFLKPSRWIVGFASNVSPAMSMRLQLTLFVDDPLDYLIVDKVVGLDVREDVFTKLPWGPTLLGIAPPLDNDSHIVLEINSQGIFPVPLEAVFLENPDTSVLPGSDAE